MNLTRGEIARQAGVGIETVRFYEKRGLMRKPQRTAANYRLYAEHEVARLRFIKRAKELGFSLKEIRELLQLHGDPHATQGDIKAGTEGKIADIRAKIEDLSRMVKALKTLSATCDGQGPIEECPILHALGVPESHAALPNHGGTR